MFVLHIWGPAFGLPSIDAECIAAVVYLNQLFSFEQWALVPSYDPSPSPTGDFPALYHESKWVGGFTAIVEYLFSEGYSLDLELSSQQRADSIALQAHIMSHAPTLVDATLYTSSSNYTSCTRPSWTKILPSHANLVVPPHRHALAKTRTIPFGLSSGTVDDLPTSYLTQQQEQEARIISNSPSLIFRRKQTLQEALQKQQSQTIFKLQSLTDSLMQPLAATMGKKRYLLSEDETGLNSIDCLTMGYLALFLYPKFPNSWVGEAIRKDFKSLADYSDRLRAEIMPWESIEAGAVMQAPNIETSDAERYLGPSDLANKLPWRTLNTPDPRATLKTLSLALVRNFVSPIQQHFIFESNLLINGPSTSLRGWFAPLTLLLVLPGPILASLGYLLFRQTHTYPEQDKRFGRARPRLSELGEAGALLSLLEPSQKWKGARGPQETRSYVGDSSKEPIIQELYEGEATLREKQDSPVFSEKPGASVAVEIEPKPENNDHGRVDPE